VEFVVIAREVKPLAPPADEEAGEAEDEKAPPSPPRAPPAGGSKP
jgi:hypothetical protein